MIKFCLMATAAFGIVSGAALAQTSVTTSTQSITQAPPVIGSMSDTVHQRSVDDNGVVTDRTTTRTTGSTLMPDGDLATTHKTVETTTTR